MLSTMWDRVTKRENTGKSPLILGTGNKCPYRGWRGWFGWLTWQGSSSTSLDLSFFFFCLFFFFFCLFLGPHLWHREVPWLGLELQLQLLAYTTAHSNAGSLTHCVGPRDWTHNLMDASWVCCCWDTMGTPSLDLSIKSPSSCVHPISYSIYLWDSVVFLIIFNSCNSEKLSNNLGLSGTWWV